MTRLGWMIVAGYLFGGAALAAYVAFLIWVAEDET